MHNLLLVLQIISAIALIVLILIQPKGQGLGRTFGASNMSFSRRGLDKLIYKLTFVIGAAFLVISALSVII